MSMTTTKSTNTAVEFAGKSRIHIGLAVTNVEKSVAFYAQLLGESPVKLRTDYAKFEPADPSVNLSLYEVSALPAGQSQNHYGVQVKSTDAVLAAAKRLRAAGISVSEELETSCCYAFQDKIWAVDPDGHRWEIFVVTGAEAPSLASQQREHCDEDSCACC